MPIFKVWSADRQIKRSLAAKSVDELKQIGCSKLDLNIAFSECLIVDESDGTLVDEDEVLLDMKDPVLLLLKPTEKWMPLPDKSESSPAGAQPTYLDLTLANTSNSQDLNPRNSTHSQEQLPAGTLDSPLDHDLSMSDVPSSSPIVSTIALPNFPTVDRIAVGQCVFCCKADMELTALVCGDKCCGKCLQECERQSGRGNKVLCPRCTNSLEGNGHNGTFSSHPATMNSPFDNTALEASLCATYVGNACHRLTIMSSLNDSSGQLLNKYNDYTEPHIQTLPKSTVAEEPVTLPIRYTGDDCQQTFADSSSIRNSVALISLMGNHQRELICQADYYKICEIISRPEVSSSTRGGFVGNVLPYLTQRVKMRGCHVLKPSNVSKLVVRTTGDCSTFTSKKRFGEEVLTVSASSRTPNDKLYQPVSRLDFITCLLNSSDDIVARDLLRIMSQFPMALPLIMRRWEHDRYVLMTSLLRGIMVKWEKASGEIIEHSLFNNPFRMIVAVRLGYNRVGKSTILNQLLTTEYMFSCSGEPGSGYGKPISLDGSAEFVWLAQETCKDAFWKSVLCPYYNEVDSEIALLANLHGCALDHLDMLSVLKQLSCKFLVFVMPDCSKYEWDHFLNEIGCSSDDVFSIHVDPEDYNPRHSNAIQTHYLLADETTEKVREAMKEAIFKCSPCSLVDATITPTERLDVAPPMIRQESQDLVNFVKNKTCRGSKEIMKFQARQAKWQHEYSLLKETVVGKFYQVLCLPLNHLQRAAIQLEEELSRLSNAESQNVRQELCQKKNELQQAMANAKLNNDDIAHRQKSMSDALDELSTMNLGLEHFVREVARGYESRRGTSGCFSQLPMKVAELFVNGHPIELLNGDDGELPTNWIAAVCKDVSRMYPNLRVYVVSILGLQSSGKSTLLNSLFACRFAVSVGRCTRGLFMRLLFLDKELVTTHNYDAILLIDTEGLGSPDKMNVAAADKKDRLLATFAMGISNLTIINVLGEYMKELVDILQIAIVTMTRLEKADISPDVLMVQHLLTEKNTARTLEAQGQFCEAIRKAIDLSEKQDIQCGVRDAKCLAVLFERIQKDTLLVQFHPFKDGASISSPPSEAYHEDVVVLYQKILESGRSSRNIMQFSKWSELVESYWGCAKEEDFALRFKNVKEIYEFIERGDRIATVKQAINAAFASHVKFLTIKLPTKIKEVSSDTKRILSDVTQELNKVPNACQCTTCSTALQSQQDLYKDVEQKPYELDTHTTIENYIQQMLQTTTNQMEQKLHALVVQQDCSNEFEPFIIEYLKKELEHDRVGKVETKRKQQITSQIFEQLRAIAQLRSKDVPVRQRIIDELQKEYHQWPRMVTEFHKQQLLLRDIIVADEGWLRRNVFNELKRALKIGLQQHHVIQSLESTINDIPDQIVQQQGADCYQQGMVGTMSGEVTRKLDKFCDQSWKLSSDAKFKIHVWAQQYFCRKMEDIQRVWDMKNKPSFILESQKQRYKQIIETRLECGFTCIAEGQLLGKDLISAIRNEAIRAENESRSNHVKGLIWTTNSEKVRLKFLEELALEVVDGKKKRALKFFSSPRKEIERWYKTTVDQLKRESYNIVSRKTFDKEFEDVMRMIKQSNNIHDMMDRSNDYMSQRGVNFVVSIDLTKTRQDDLDVLISTVVQTLEQNRQTKIEEEMYRSPSEDPDVMSLLGCTHTCFWCSAICWGQRGHEENADDTKKHFSSHQPNGLAGTRFRGSNELIAEPCYETGDHTTVYFGDFQENGMPWGKAKEHFADWKFDRYHNVKFDRLMRWLFSTLNEDIAADRKCVPASQSDLRKYNCLQLDINEILNRIRLEVS